MDPESPGSPEPTVDEDGRVILTGISSRAFEHPADRAALTALRAVPGFDQIVKLATGMLRERQYRLAYLASAVRVDERQFADLHRLLGDVVAVLDAPRRPELFVYNDPTPNAITLGVDRPFITMSSGLYEQMNDDERRFILGHELGHALSGHALYQSLLMHLLNLAGSFGWVPAGGLGLRALIAALREWQRKAELSADRAGLLATQDVDVSLRVHMKTAAGAHLDQIDSEAFLAQAAEYEAAGDLRDGVLKLLNTENTTHPFAVVRAAEVQRWVATGEYARILAGDYPLRTDDRSAGFTDSAREAARSYKKRIDESTDPLVTAVRGLGSTVGSAADSIFDWFNRRTRGPDESSIGETGTEPPNGEIPPDDAPPAPDRPADPQTDSIFDWFERRDRGRNPDPPAEPPPA
jgi:Zn-dependent protease with chaperone function